MEITSWIGGLCDKIGNTVWCVGWATRQTGKRQKVAAATGTSFAFGSIEFDAGGETRRARRVKRRLWGRRGEREERRGEERRREERKENEMRREEDEDGLVGFGRPKSLGWDDYVAN
jgi:hypothetical protein